MNLMEKNYHFIGIKGSGMSALANILYDEGYHVQGSDVETYFFTQVGLEMKNIPVLPFDESNIKENMSIILGNAFSDDHPEVVRAKELNLDVSRYNHFLGEYIKQYTSIGVSGAHGKTSTTGLLAHILSGLDKTSYLIGDGTGRGVENARYFALEADEYRGHFLTYQPDYGIITNIDFDHPDYFKDLDHVMRLFDEYANQVKKAVIACGDDANVRRLSIDTKTYYYGLEDHNDFIAKNILKKSEGSVFDIEFQGEKLGTYQIPLYGNHNIQNAASVIAVCYLEGLDLELVKDLFLSYPGVKRRFNEKLIYNQHIIDDYAHHPNEISATIDASKQRHPDKKIVAVFQPHTFSRTEALMERFAQSLNEADAVYLAPIFASAREQSGKVTIEDLAQAIPQDVTILTIDDIRALLDHKEDVLLFMGAGNIQDYMNAYIELVSE
ncbi:MAG: UDP-N-acetylmuramate--L-alanine ligase [Atopococcus tabaci]|uniref:UDP-N-acetylmuramate--L-alanine ligase n=1 Tax=Atopococcus tabaci TaxID=269774 RepID=A0AA43UC80_9LACT|nr:UDP-N-acetylmuramate--L-alanine ligase [Atopococcus tabaci]